MPIHGLNGVSTTPVTRWAVASIYQARPWPSAEQTIQYGTRNVSISPQTGDLFPAIYVTLGPDESYDSGWVLLARFLSCLVWAAEGEAAIIQFGGGSTPAPYAGFSRSSFGFVPYYRGKFGFAELPVLPSEQALVLAFWREACSLEHTAPHYALLNFFKIVERGHSGGIERRNFFDRFLSELTPKYGHFSGWAVEAVADLEHQGHNISEYLYERCRNAVAHASARFKPSDPDDLAEQNRMKRALPIMKAAAYECIIADHGVPEPHNLPARK